MGVPGSAHPAGRAVQVWTPSRRSSGGKPSGIATCRSRSSGPSMAIARRKADPDGITTAQLAGTVGRYVSRKPLDVEAAVTELREIANGRGDLLAERAGVTLGFYARENRDEWPRKGARGRAAHCCRCRPDPAHGMDRGGAGASREDPLDEGHREIPASLPPPGLARIFISASTSIAMGAAKLPHARLQPARRSCGDGQMGGIKCARSSQSRSLQQCSSV